MHLPRSGRDRGGHKQTAPGVQCDAGGGCFDLGPKPSEWTE